MAHRFRVFTLLSLVFACTATLIQCGSTPTPDIPLVARGEITDITRYPEILQAYGDSILVRHFPKTVPAEASYARLVYLPHVMQGPEVFQLRLQLPSEQIQNLYAEFQPRAEHHFQGQDPSDYENSPGGVPSTRFYTGDTEDLSFPPTYEILILDAQPAGSPNFEWNHGYSYGVAIDVLGSEIVYWLQYW